jgi:hypothetical protein
VIGICCTAKLDKISRTGSVSWLSCPGLTTRDESDRLCVDQTDLFVLGER